MIRYPLSTLLVAALGTAALSPVMAQGTPARPKPGGSTKSAAPAKNTPPRKTPAKATTGTKAGGEDVVVGRVGDKVFTWGQVLDQLRKTPQGQVALTSSVAQAVAGEVATTLFGPTPKDHYTITRAEALTLLRKHPTRQIVNQLELMLREEAVNMEASKEGVQPTDQQVDDRVTRLLKDLRKQNVIPANQSDDDFLKSRNVSREQLRKNFRPQVQVTNLIDKEISKQLGHKLGPDDLVQARHLLIKVNDPAPDAKPDAKAKADADALARIKQIEEDIKTGKKTFEQAAKESSEDPGSKEQGGDLGIFMRGMMLKEFENAAFNATPHMITDPVRTSAGYHLILVENRGKDIPADARQKFIDDYEDKQILPYLNKLTGQILKVENRLAPLAPQQPGIGMSPGAPPG